MPQPTPQQNDARPHRQTKGEQTVRRILDVAEARFAERGYDAASLREIARGVGIKQPGLYNYFESKEALYTAVLDRALRPLSEALEGVMNDQNSNGIPATLASVMTDLLLAHPQMSALFQRALQGDPNTTGNRLIKNWLDKLFAQATAGRGADSLSETERLDSALETIAMFNLTTGYFLSEQILSTLAGRSVTDAEVVERQKALLDRLSRGLRRDR
jgi:AcrR family transcriptional regulator